MNATHPAGQSEGGPERCEICDKPLIAGQRVMQDVELGTVHAACCGPEREAYVKDVDTGEPLGPNDPIPQGYVYEPELADGPSVRTILARLWCQAEGIDPDDTISDAGHTVLDCTLGGLDKKAFVAIVEAERAILKATTPPGAPRYQYREIGEGEGWRDCSRESYLAFASDPHIDTREIKGHPAGQSAGSGVGWAEVVKAICSAVCRVEGLDPDELQQEYESEAHGWRETDPQWTRYATAVAEVLDNLPLPAPDSTRTGQGEAEGRDPVTEAQIRAGVEELAFSPVGDEARTAGGRALVRAIYRAMLAARPAAPEAQGLDTDKPLPLTHTNRGFAIAKFYDRYGEECSIQKSSLAEEDCIWLGADRDGAGRMHLSQETTARLLPLLQRFVTTGEIEPAPPASSGQEG